MKILYFDIDGTILRDSRPKPALAHGALERAVKTAGFARLVCVSNVITTIQFMKELGQEIDGLGVVFDVCRRTIHDPAWFRSITKLVSDPEHRARCIDFEADWWYLDDMARWYMEQDHLSEVYEENLGVRLFVPNQDGDGSNVLHWLLNHNS
jgi:hypothetical protein